MAVSGSSAHRTTQVMLLSHGSSDASYKVRLILHSVDRQKELEGWIPHSQCKG